MTFLVTLTLTLTSDLISRMLRIWSISPIVQITFLKCALCYTNSFGGIRHVTVTCLVVVFFVFVFLLLFWLFFAKIA